MLVLTLGLSRPGTAATFEPPFNPADTAVALVLAGAALLAGLFWRLDWIRNRRRNPAPDPDSRPGPGSHPLTANPANPALEPPPHSLTATEPTPSPAPAAQRHIGIADLLQQAEFLALLGERDAAVALLQAHLDGPGARDMPVWLRLMHVHRRFGDRHSFELTRTQYRQRFDSEAPPWAADVVPTAGMPAAH
jgi:hypothetical protein